MTENEKRKCGQIYDPMDSEIQQEQQLNIDAMDKFNALGNKQTLNTMKLFGVQFDNRLLTDRYVNFLTVRISGHFTGKI